MHDGLAPPKYLLAKVAEEANDVASKPLDQTLFTEPVRNFPASFPPCRSDRPRINKLRTPCATEVLPAYAKFATFVKDEYEPKGACGVRHLVPTRW